VIKLDRVIFAGLTKKDLPRGHWRHLTKQEVINLGMIKWSFFELWFNSVCCWVFF